MSNTKKRLIVFLIPPEKLVNGGILSIFSICKVSRQFKDIHHAEVLLSTYPGTNSYKKNDLFENDEIIYSFDEIVKLGVPEFLQLHVPEYASYDTFMALKGYTTYIRSIPDFRVNIMNQNILVMQPPAEVANWLSLSDKVTQTTAHDKYTTQELADRYNIPTRHLSTFVDQSQYSWIPYEKKENLIVLSPDVNKYREKIVKLLKDKLPAYKLLTIQNMTYETYKKTMAKAKFAITFGEGFDGYYIESFFSGGMTFAVYNADFFPDKEFAEFENVFASYDSMLAHLIADIAKLDNKTNYEKVVQKNLKKANQLYSFKTYTDNIKQFYLGNYSYVPRTGSAAKLLSLVVADKDRIIDDRDKQIRGMNQLLVDRDRIITQRDESIAERDQRLASILSSKSWQLTKPLRKVVSILKRSQSKTS